MKTLHRLKSSWWAGNKTLPCLFTPFNVIPTVDGRRYTKGRIFFPIRSPDDLSARVFNSLRGQPSNTCFYFTYLSICAGPGNILRCPEETPWIWGRSHQVTVTKQTDNYLLPFRLLNIQCYKLNNWLYTIYSEDTRV